MDSRQPNSLAAQPLKIVGIILIISSLVDYLILLFPPNFLQRQWQMALTTQLVERGIIPMVGLALLLAGFGLEGNLSSNYPNRKTPIDLKFWAFLLSSFLGLVFLLLFPLHLNNVRLDRTEKLEQINARASQLEAQLQTQLNTPDIKKQIESEQSRLKSQLSQLMENEQRLNEALNSPAVPEPLKEVLRKSKENPKAIDEFVEQRFNTQTLENQQLTQIRGQKEQLMEQTKITALKSGLQTGISSLLLAAGYIAIGWSGLKNMGYLKVGRRKAPVR
ncbi:MAG: HpsJ family protein [Oscillatoriaceae bacterium SKW80]|nr:HpsJ family protein [Oscillatoriaceae bacterium SKYG93]MCX8120760.1 HpsJ family protein [Oscillatoriaceae bacterium SKW80]MDW8452125.1 HpsJ family protein [Oscillatoriaceae cyanobacterium SKYGB_i_bin93]HIK27779.1 hypothetical protein [Oscillatoriaceae cyanobacterium M7585_C2015_266]